MNSRSPHASMRQQIAARNRPGRRLRPQLPELRWQRQAVGIK
jgi:hypothetical protein